MSRKSGREQEARDREHQRYLQEPVKYKSGEVWGCRKWMGCGTRWIDYPPDSGPHLEEKCSTHHLPITTLITAHRVIGASL